MRQLDRVLGEALTRAWRAGAGPGKERLVVDVDSFLGEVHGYPKQGASYGYDGRRGYHPLIATRAETGEVLHIRTRKGSANTSRASCASSMSSSPASSGPARRARSCCAPTRAFGATRRWSACDAGWHYSIGVRMQPHVKAAIERIDEREWTPLAGYPEGGEAQIAETALAGRRLVVRRTRLTGEQAELFPDWRHFAFLTNRTEPLVVVEAEHRQHAVVELAIRDLKDQALAHFPSGKFNANAAWAALAALAHNLLRWTGLLGLPGTTVRTARTLRRRFLALPGRLTRTPGASPCTCRRAGPGAPSATAGAAQGPARPRLSPSLRSLHLPSRSGPRPSRDR